MSNLVIVALPSEDDYVNKISSEKVAHMTLLFLGEDATKVPNLTGILDFTRHAAEKTINRFGLEVDRRGELGEKKADVLFFSKARWSGYETIRDFRSNLLKDNSIRTAFDMAEQHDEWVPHLTLGYPETPAHPDERDFPGISYVNFDRIAVWFGDFEGIEFPLKAHEWDIDMAMGTSVPFMTATTNKILDEILEHHGVKGQKWGIRRKATVGAQEVVVSDRRKKLKTSGGEGHPAHPDAVRARTSGQIAKKSGVKALSNEELQAYTKRLQLEQSLKRLSYNDKPAAHRFILKTLGQTGQTASQEISNEASQQVKKQLVKAVATAL